MKLEQLTETLIDIESVTGNEQEILTFIEDYLIKNKFTGEIIKNDGGLIAYHSKSNSKVALVGHVDTVPIVDDQERLSDSEKISGRGAVDMKSGIAVMINTLLDEKSNEVGIFYTAEEGPIKENGLDLISSDLDEFHGHFHENQDFPNGIYHYHITADAPYLNGLGYYGLPGTVTQ